MGWIISKALYESLHCSQGLEEESSEDTYLDGELSAPLSGNPTQLAYLPPDKMTAFSRLSRFGMTFKPLTANLGEELLTLYREDFPARTYPVQEREQGLKESDQECGNTWQGLLAKFDPVLSLWKTAQCSLLEDLEQSLETWPRWGSMRNGACYQRRESVRHTSESVFGFSLPTPVASDATSGAVIGKNDTYYATSTGMPRKVNQKGTDGSVGLGRLVQMWPTPTAHNAKETNAPSEALRHEPTLASRVGGHLNPDWVEWLMNWPITWSNLNAINPKEFQRWKETSAAAIQEFSELRTMWWDKDPAQASSGQQSGEQREQERGCTLQQVSRVSTRQPEMEGSYEGSGLPLLRNGIHLQAGQRENVQQGMREQACVDETQIVPRVASGVTARVDRLKAIGNGQVPIVAATAFRILTEAR